MKLEPDEIIGDDGDREVLCEHGIGHSIYVHTCDGCCFRLPLAAHKMFARPAKEEVSS